MYKAAAVALALSGCSMMIDTHRAPPADWPRLTVVEHHVPHNVMRDRCAPYVGWGGAPEACAEWHFARGECHLWFSADFPPKPYIVRHERLHCLGYDHPGDDTAARAWARWKNR
jgi:hypothetical protein